MRGRAGLVLTLSVGWIVASGILLACKFFLCHQDLTNVEASFYNALNRVAFALGLGWVIFVCIIGQGGVVNSILSWKAFIPLSRITYGAYLVHPIVMNTYFNSMRALIIYSTFNMKHLRVWGHPKRILVPNAENVNLPTRIFGFYIRLNTVCLGYNKKDFAPNRKMPNFL
ncbi:hypothetical protein AVEN_186751-1 [Araneus ventricosus]|uniref:Nose resistant to fluoxetine protein 6 n=1 Tax=Araneus ventricosus TaxID=182803 RepID=A0A4Y2SFQ3_ARAVE|nr:hypothetical protein AVEN_186751-1 [Araneus ventricosus]